jgi:hypothetical protein
MRHCADLRQSDQGQIALKRCCRLRDRSRFETNGKTTADLIESPSEDQ